MWFRSFLYLNLKWSHLKRYSISLKMLKFLQSILHFEAYKLCEPTVKNMHNNLSYLQVMFFKYSGFIIVTGRYTCFYYMPPSTAQKKTTNWLWFFMLEKMLTTQSRIKQRLLFPEQRERVILKYDSRNKLTYFMSFIGTKNEEKIHASSLTSYSWQAAGYH